MDLRLPGFSKRIPLFIIFRALGYESDKEILEINFWRILRNDVNSELIEDLVPTIENSSLCLNKFLLLNI